MYDVSNRLDVPSVHTYRTDKYENQNVADNGETSILMETLDSVRNSTQELNKGSTSGRISGYLYQTWQRLQTAYNGQSSVGNGGNEGGTELQEIFTEGENLRLMANSQHTSAGEESRSDAWKGSLFKRYLVGVGLLSGAGAMGAGYQYYAGRNAANANPAGNTRALSLGTSVEPATLQQGSGGTLEDSFGNYSLTHHDNTGNKVRHRSRALSNRALEHRNAAQSVNNNVCRTKVFYEKCQTAHKDAAKNGIMFNRLVLHVGKKPCHCPNADATRQELASMASADWGHNYEFPDGFDPLIQSFRPLTTRRPPADFYWGNNVGILTGYDPTLHKK